MKSHTKAWKHSELEKVKKLVESYPVIAIASLEGFPAKLFAQIRKKLHGKAEVHVSKVRVIQKALEASKLKDSKLKELAEGSIAIIGTSMNPFELFGYLKKSKGSMAAKAGMLAPFDLMVPAMDTGLPPGPALSELKAAGLNVRIMGSTISVVEDKVVTKQGVAVTPAVASVLQKLDIRPIKVGLNLVAVFENNEIFMASVLDIDEEQTLENIAQAFNNALNVAVFAGIFNNESTPIMIQKAFREAKAVSIEAEFIEPETAADILAKAERQAMALKALVKEENA
ncbi:MAG: 50S ribosomal protein L10 [Candidatus Diapherotrites archaeon]|nr:50S ribosomal protein L10 [Candidatus Diapherotrites archaeon]